MSESSSAKHAVNDDSRHVTMNVAGRNIKAVVQAVILAVIQAIIQVSLDVNLQGVQVPLLTVLMKETTDMGRGAINTYGQTFSQPTSQSYLETSGYNTGTKDAYDGRQDNRKIDRNIKDPNNNNQGNWKTFVACGVTAFCAGFAGYMTARTFGGHYVVAFLMIREGGMVFVWLLGHFRFVLLFSERRLSVFGQVNVHETEVDEILGGLRDLDQRHLAAAVSFQSRPFGLRVSSSHLKDFSSGCSADGETTDSYPWTIITHGDAGQPLSPPTSQTDFDGAHDYNADTDNYNEPQHSSGSSGEDAEAQYNQETSEYDRGTEGVYDGRNADGQIIAEDLPSKPTNTGHFDGPSQNVDNINGGYTEQDNKGIGHNAENVENYYEDSTVNNGVINNSNNQGGGVATTAFYAGHTTAAVQGPAIPTNYAIAIIYPQYSFNQAPSLVMSFVVLPVVLMNLLSLVRQRLVAGVM
ncbi:hypothetical protein K435DRAFT_921994 [Dendrothele bispora CBS 962.96]|uniref:Uncharacterized protein n=1 Tax=Dendrothele bispora (strain CBS 962.96) TaxID=1314807 RepID=A0A4S8LCY2_DENBC|nr:hypothetical protein K435DRAFT_921994 [Dendrothele bispora CBS 962.96]